VVGIGASAGGLAALRTLLEALPPTPNVAIVVVVHLSPDRESRLAPLLQSHTPLPVAQVVETIRLEPNRVYVIPPNANLDAIDTHLRLSPLEERRAERAPIDHFLRTLAATHDGNSVGVILTGAGSDGALGIRAVRQANGLTIAQDPAEAEHDGMPRSAIATGMIDLVLPLREIPARIVAFCARRGAADRETAVDAGDDLWLARMREAVRAATGTDIGMLARDALLSRVRHRMQIREAASLPDYQALLEQGGGEARALLRDLLLTVTEFFREPEVYRHLEEAVLPAIFARKPSSQDRVRAWSIGCAMGEEAYSVAIALLERCARVPICPRLQVFASDLEDSMLERARAGRYPAEIAASVPEERLRTYFDAELGQYEVRPEVREIVVFSRHDLFADPPYAHLDLILCRTLLRKLRPGVRAAVLQMFHYALEPHGVLIVNPADPVDGSGLFVAENAATGVYRRADRSRAALAWPAIHTYSRPARAGRPALPGPTPDPITLYRLAIERHVPASALVDGEAKVLYYSQRAGQYLRVPGGELTHELPRLVAEPLRSRLTHAVAEVVRTGAPWVVPPLTVQTEHGPRHVVLRVEPVAHDDLRDLLLVVFEEAKESTQEETAAHGNVSGSMAHLEVELEAAYRLILELRDRTGPDPTVQLAPLVEQLETSREELQTLNEELTTLDEENRRRLDDLTELSAELQHLLDATGVATVFLNRNLELRKMTPPAAEIFRARPSDLGRPLADLAHDLLYPELAAEVARVLHHDTPSDREVQARDGRWFLLRMLPYRLNNAVDGVVLSLLDISERKRSELKLRDADRRKDEFLALLAHELRNPLAPISAGIEVLRRTASEPKIVEQVTNTISRQTKQLVRLVDDLLEVSRVTGGRLRLTRSPVPLNEVIRDAVAAVRPVIDAESHTLSVATTDEALVVNGDSARLTQVVANLLTNAARYTPRGGVLALLVSRDGEDAVIRVRDNGIGIGAEHLPHVFEMFYQGDNPRMNAGLGIGLTLAKSLVEMHGGTITVESSGNNQGSEFTIRLPTARNARPAEHQPPPDPTGLSGHRVLIVDDNLDAAETLRLLLGSLGHNEICTAPNGHDALLKAAALHPDIVLLDLKMPGIDGYEVARRIRCEPWGADVMLVALTGWAQEEHRRRTKAAGFNYHLAKPAVRGALESLLREQAARAAAATS
jgi:two-component system CheB/CheR fusion protein